VQTEREVRVISPLVQVILWSIFHFLSRRFEASISIYLFSSLFGSIWAVILHPYESALSLPQLTVLLFFLSL
jgi:hypothetical protein